MFEEILAEKISKFVKIDKNLSEIQEYEYNAPPKKPTQENVMKNTGESTAKCQSPLKLSYRQRLTLVTFSEFFWNLIKILQQPRDC
jgi:hypothetical protein